MTQPLLLAAGRARGARPLLRPSQSIAATARRSTERALLAKPVVEAPLPAPARRVGLAAFVAAALVVCVVGASVVYYRTTNRATDSQLADQLAPGPRAPVAEATSVLPPQLAPKSVSDTTSASNAAATTGTPPSGEAAKPEPPKRIAKPRAPPPEPLPTAPEPPPTVAAAPVVEAPPPVREAPPVDPMQQMRDALARCGNGDLIDRILCDQRVRREYCATRWGLVPQCPSGVANDRGQ